jgi:hypothetical protein
MSTRCNAHADMPEVTEAHRQAAFEGMHWKGWTYEQAMQFPMRRKLIECRAAVIRKAEWEATTKRTTVPVRRVRLGLDGHPVGYVTQMVSGPRKPIQQPDLL